MNSLSSNHRLARHFELGVSTAPVGKADAELAELMASQGILPVDIPGLREEFPNIIEDEPIGPQKQPQGHLSHVRIGASVVDIFSRKVVN